MHLTKTELPIYMAGDTGKLSFQEGLTCGGTGVKTVGEMAQLFENTEGVPEDEVIYEVYRDICFEPHRRLFSDYDIRYDITVIHPGTVNGECKKTSGHYHGLKEGTGCTYPEIYQVIKGDMIFLFQKSDGDEVKEIKAVMVKEGESVVIPPSYGHCAINPTDGYVAFCNLAALPCPIYYDMVQKKRGLSVRVFREKESVVFRRNLSYGAVPDVVKVVPLSGEEFGSVHGISCYGSFVRQPEKYKFLLNPEEHAEEMNHLIQEVQE